ncbi:MAG: hypothetical protein MUF00_01100 [Gemmatimonadaceae bacterium]|jgi:chemotaxis regulatin CheY-phosphate phosphatase CheZ|nr:hypothetical protein [Gemmatimonadaceae bacterium]
MTSDRAHALYYDSAATLRLVDTQLDDLRDGDADGLGVADAAPAPVAPTPRATISLAELPFLLERANTEINGLLARLRESRGALQATAVDKLTHTQAKLREVTDATEVAATDILDACDRASAKLDELDALDGAVDTERARSAQLRLELRDEIFTMMAALQFQDLTTQMLSHATAVLTEVEERLQEVAKIFDGSAFADAATPATKVPTVRGDLTFDPNATVLHADRRQAVADEVFTTGRTTAAA